MPWAVAPAPPPQGPFYAAHPGRCAHKGTAALHLGPAGKACSHQHGKRQNTRAGRSPARRNTGSRRKKNSPFAPRRQGVRSRDGSVRSVPRRSHLPGRPHLPQVFAAPAPERPVRAVSVLPARCPARHCHFVAQSWPQEGPLTELASCPPLYPELRFVTWPRPAARPGGRCCPPLHPFHARLTRHHRPQKVYRQRHRRCCLCHRGLDLDPPLKGVQGGQIPLHPSARPLTAAPLQLGLSVCVPCGICCGAVCSHFHIPPTWRVGRKNNVQSVEWRRGRSHRGGSCVRTCVPSCRTTAACRTCRRMFAADPPRHTAGGKRCGCSRSAAVGPSHCRGGTGLGGMVAGTRAGSRFRASFRTALRTSAE